MLIMRCRIAIVLLLLAAMGTAFGAEQVIWWEGEDAVETNFPGGNPFGVTAEMKQVLSGGEWLEAGGNRYGPPLFATYDVAVPRTASYDFWVRKFWYHGPFRWRFDQGPWHEVGRDIGLFDSVNLRPNIVANWVYLDRIELAEGTHRLRIETTDAVPEKPAPVQRTVPPVTAERVTMKLNEWCTVTLPKEVAVGQTIPVKVAYRDINEKTHLCCDLSWKKADGGFGGFVAQGSPYPQVQGDGEHTFQIKIVYKSPYMASVFCTIFLSPQGTWETRTASVTSSQVPLAAEGLQPPPQGASAAAFDCFVLSEGAFFPRGKLKPGQKYGRTEEGWFPFEPDPDPFDGSALLDLRYLNDKESGDRGYLRTRGMDLVFEKEGRPVKFWGPCVGRDLVMQNPSMVDHFARRMAKLGCNMVRLHGSFHGGVKGDPLGISDSYMEHFNYFVAALKRQGIYLMLNTYYDHFLTVTPQMGLPGYKAGQMTPHFQFIHPMGQEIWKRWVTRLLTARNPYTGMRNAEDPTIAIIQLVNEDNYFWYTFRPYATIPAPVIQVLEERFAAWLRAKYGSLEAARAAWGPGTPQVRGDAFDEGRVGLFPSSALRAGHREGQQRYNDQTQFMTEDLRSVLGSFQDYLKAALGYKGLVNGGNWKSANPSVLEPLDKWANAVCDVMDRHGVGWYKGPIKMVKSWTLSVGDIYQDLSPLRDPDGTPLMDTQYAGKVHVISEPKSPLPNRFRTDWTPLTAVYGLVQGTDAFTHFSGAVYWLQSHARWSLDVPTHAGQFPATALIFRNRYIEEGPVVVREALKLSDLYRLKGAAVQEAAGLDEMTRANVPEGELAPVEKLGKVDPQAYFVGEVVREIGPDPGPSQIAELSQYIDRDRRLIRSANGELVWDWDTGLLRIDAPCAQGVVGFLREGGPQTLTDLTVDGRNEYGSILVVSMDGKPLNSSARILLQVMTEDRNFGYRTEPVQVEDNQGRKVQARRITDLGKAPIVVRRIEGSVTIRRPDAHLLRVTALDENGYKRQELPGAAGEALTIELLPDCFYYIIRMP